MATKLAQVHTANDVFDTNKPLKFFLENKQKYVKIKFFYKENIADDFDIDEYVEKSQTIFLNTEKIEYLQEYKRK